MASPSNEITLKFQREINRISDSDRNTRKSGLKKLLENLPWNTTNTEEAEALRLTCKEVIFEPLLTTLVDPVEKCRECSLGLLTKIVHLFRTDLDFQSLSTLASILCSRVNDTPFPETSEELRFQVIQLLRTLCPFIFHETALPTEVKSMSEMIIPAVGKALVDLFPDVKKGCSEIIIDMGKLTTTDAIRAHYKILLKGLIVNASHQHYKVRSLAIKVSAMYPISTVVQFRSALFFCCSFIHSFIDVYFSCYCASLCSAVYMCIYNRH